MKILSIALAALCVATARAFAAIKAGNKLPQATLFQDFGPPQKINIAEYAAGYLENQDALKEAGIDEVLVFCVNDSAVMKAWEADQGVKGSMITFMGDPLGEFTKACDMELTHPGPASVGLVGRCKRFAMYVEKNVIKYVAVSESDDDPAGDADPSATCHEAMLKAITMQQEKSYSY